MRKKAFVSLLLGVVMVLTLAPMTVSAADITVWIDSSALVDGENSIGGGTATLNKTEGTLILENVAADSIIDIRADGTFTVTVKGSVSVGSDAAKTSGVALYSTASDLSVHIEQGATLSLYTENGNNVYANGGNLTVSGPGKLKAVAVAGSGDAYPCLVATNNLTLNGGLIAELSSEWTGVYTEKGNIMAESVNLTVTVDGIGLFAQTYDEVADEGIPSSVTLKDSAITITSNYGDAAIFCGTGGLVVENTVLKTKADKDEEMGGYSLYSEGDVVIRGEQTEITADDAFGIESGGTLYIEGGVVSVLSTDVALLGWDGVSITGGTVTATAENNSAIIGRNGAVSITGANTRVTATANGEEAAIRNVTDGGIYLEASVTAVNTQGGKPFLGVKADKSEAIALGEGFDLFGAQIYTSVADNNSQSYFIPAGGDGSEPLTGSSTLCKHVWGEPVWDWAQDYSGATATFTCANDSSHTQTVTAGISVQTTEATCGKDGQTVYTASAALAGTNYGSQKTVVIPATGQHAYEDGKCTVCGAADPAYQPAETPETPDGVENPDTGDYRQAALIAIFVLLMCAGLTGPALAAVKRKSV